MTCRRQPRKLRKPWPVSDTRRDKVGVMYGYARVSTYGQTLDAQLEQLRGAGCAKIFREKVTVAHSDRRQLLTMLDTLTPRDVVTATRIDRLAPSSFDLLAIVSQIVDVKAIS